MQDNDNMKVHVNVEFDSPKMVEAQLESIIKDLSDKAEIDLSFKSNGIDKELEKASKKQAKFKLGVDVTTVALETLSVVLDDNLNMMDKWSVAVDGVGNALLMTGNAYAMIAGVVLKAGSIIVDQINKEKKALDELKESAKGNIQTIGGQMQAVSDLGSEYDYLVQKANRLGGAAALPQDEQERYYELMQEISTLMPDLYMGPDEQGRAMIDTTVSSQEMIDMLKERLEVEKELYELQKKDDIKDKQGQIEDNKDEIKDKEDYIELLNQDINSMQKRGVSVDGEDMESELLREKIYQLEKNKESVASLYKENEDLQVSIDRLNGITKNGTDINKEYAMSQEEMKRSFEEGRNGFANSTDQLKEYKGYLEELNNNGTISSDGLTSILEDYPDYIAYMDDDQAQKEQLQAIIKELETTQAESLRGMMESSEVYYAQRVKGNWEVIKELRNGYDANLQDAKNLAEAKIRVEEALLQHLSNKWGEYFDADQGLTEEWQNLMEEAPNKGIRIYDEYKKSVEEVQDTFNNFTKDDVSEALANISLDGMDSNGSGYQQSLKAIRHLVDVFAELDLQIKNNENAQKDLQSIMQDLPEHSTRRIELLEKENDLLRENQNLLHGSAEQYRSIKADSKGELVDLGVEFIDDKDIDFESYNQKVKDLNKQLLTAEGDKKSILSDKLNQLETSLKDYITAETEITGFQQQWWDDYRAIKENEFESKLVEIKGYDQQLSDIKHEMDLMGEIDSYDEQRNSAKLFNKQQQTLAQQLQVVTQTMMEYENQLNALNEETDEGAKKGAILRGQIEELDGMQSEIELTIAQNYEAEKERMINTVKEVEDTIIEIVEQRIEDQEKEENKAHEEELARLEEKKEKWEEYYDSRLNALKEEQEEIDHENNMAELLEEKSRLQQEINKLSLDDSIEAKAKQQELSEELSALEKDIAQENRDYEFSQLEEQIEKEKEEKLKSIELLEQEENDRHEQELENLEKAKEKEALYAEAHKILMTQTHDEIAAMISAHQDRLGEGFSIIGDQIKDGIVAQLEAALDIMEQMNFGVDNKQIGAEINNNSSTLIRPIEFQGMSDEDYQDYVNNKLTWYLGGEDYKEITARLNRELRNEYGIGDDNYTYFDLVNLGSTGEKITSSNIQGISIDNLLRIDGDVGAAELEILQDEVDIALKKLEDELIKNGIYRPI
ncbi:coiled-coil domain-containing protein [Vallitalea okinawensis]|uniref:hypothetical protein n=1 Tax=Vallitalea okinawensis TaxID=2078660 RepID=UPI000CFD2C94|nr:hypothetical protein [Vallitalea okinawensis]